MVNVGVARLCWGTGHGLWDRSGEFGKSRDGDIRETHQTRLWRRI